MAHLPKPISPDSASRLAIVFDQLACPACLGTLQMETARLVCTGCARVYPVLDGIPILIAEQADAAKQH